MKMGVAIARYIAFDAYLPAARLNANPADILKMSP